MALGQAMTVAGTLLVRKPKTATGSSYLPMTGIRAACNNAAGCLVPAWPFRRVVLLSVAASCCGS